MDISTIGLTVLNNHRLSSYMATSLPVFKTYGTLQVLIPTLVLRLPIRNSPKLDNPYVSVRTREGPNLTSEFVLRVP
jgi:hypothetical protein